MCALRLCALRPLNVACALRPLYFVRPAALRLVAFKCFVRLVVLRPLASMLYGPGGLGLRPVACVLVAPQPLRCGSGVLVFLRFFMLFHAVRSVFTSYLMHETLAGC